MEPLFPLMLPALSTKHDSLTLIALRTIRKLVKLKLESRVDAADAIVSAILRIILRPGVDNNKYVHSTQHTGEDGAIHCVEMGGSFGRVFSSRPASVGAPTSNVGRIVRSSTPL